MPAMEHTGSNIWAKKCTRCDIKFEVIASTYNSARTLMLEHFIHHLKNPDDLDSRCKSCNSSVFNGRASLIHREQMLNEQIGKCGICETPISFKKRNAYVDHDHQTGHTRKVLCPRCNTWMSGVDNNEWLAKALAYRNLFRCE